MKTRTPVRTTTMRLRALSNAKLASVRGGDETLISDGAEDEVAHGYIRVKKLNSG